MRVARRAMKGNLMDKASILKVVGGLSAVGLTVGIVTAAQADDTATSTPSPTETTQGYGGPGDQTELTGDALAQATASAQAAVPGGNVLRVEADGDGAIHAHVRTAEGTEVKVLMDGDYAVTSVEEFTGGRGGPGGRGGDTPLTGDAATQATEAAQAAVPGGSVLRVEQEPDGSIHAHVRTDDGTHVLVVMDSSYQVTSVDELPARGGRGSDKESRSTTEDGTTA